ncbi:hypothetical protein QVD17_31767 [Tagetes erecta]|uniref:CCHC-type domain-containing protein n=1 Tax=Tagetes erecta TaxID=13708 RepID=A0AAD8K544_TARER|nr:hypothetical protein QVD17_31767 [Tagetes erecta]
MAGDKDGKNDEKMSNQNESKSIDPSSPYYIHASDYPRQMQVNDPLTDNNYIDWSQEMTNFLFAKNKMEFVDGTIPKPQSTDETYMKWMRCDAMIKGWLTTAMEKTIRSSVKYANTAKEIWDDLKERFGKESAPRAYELKQTLTITHQNGSSVSAYYTKLRSLWDEIGSVRPLPSCKCGTCTCDMGKKMVDYIEKERLYEFLMGLDSDFSTIRTQLLSIKPIPTLGEAYRLAFEDEQQRNITLLKKPHVEPSVFQTSTQYRREGNNNQQRYKSNQKEGKRSSPTESEQCTHCGKNGHNREGCFERIGYPEWWPGKTKRERGKPKVGCVDGEIGAVEGTVGGLTEEQYQTLLKHFSGETSQGEFVPKANMAGLTLEEVDWCGQVHKWSIPDGNGGREKKGNGFKD